MHKPKIISTFASEKETFINPLIPKSRKGKRNMKANEVRLVNVNQDKCKVFFHLTDGKTIVRTMDIHDIMNANKMRRTGGEAAKIAEYVRLLNEKYSEPQVINYVELTTSERRFFELHHMRSVGFLTPEEEDEYQRLLDE